MRSLNGILKTRRGIMPFDPTTWIQRNSDAANLPLYSSGYGNGVFSIGGNAAVIQTASSADIATWTVSYPGLGGGQALYAVKYGNGLWVAVGAAASVTGLIYTSIAPETLWTSRTTSFLATPIYCVGYGNGLWVATGTAGRLATSTDGITWTQRVSSFGSAEIHCVSYGNGYWVAGGALGKLATSTDGITWTQRVSSMIPNHINSVDYGNGYWVIVGSVGKIATSVDPTILWTNRADLSGNHLGGVLYGSGYWLAQQTAGGIIYTTVDPTGAWSSQDLSTFTKNGFNYSGDGTIGSGIAYDSDNGIWVLAGVNAANQGMILTSTS